MLLADTIDQILQGTTGTLVPREFIRGYDAAAPIDEFPRAQCIEVLDDRICPLCAHVDGMIFDRRSPEYSRYRLPSHINCRRVWAFIAADEVGPDGRPTQPDFEAPPQELIDAHGHFVSEPEKYAALRVPSRPTGRDFIAYRAPGEPHVTLRWRDALPRPALEETLQTMAAGIADPAALDIPGDVELAIQIMDHASQRGLWTDFTGAYAQHASDWPAAGVLSPEQYRALPEQTMNAPGAGMGTDTDEDGTVRWFVHADTVPTPDAELDDVTMLYRPDRAGIETVARLPEDGA